MQILNDPLFETLWKNVIFCIFFAFFLQLTISILCRFLEINLLFSFFCRNFASDFVTNSRGKSESSGAPTKLAKQCFGGESGDNGAPYFAKRNLLSTIWRTRFVPFHRAIIEPLSSHCRGNHETKLLIIVDNCWPPHNPHMQPVGDNRLQAFFDILKLPLRGGSLPIVNGKWTNRNWIYGKSSLGTGYRNR